MSNLQFFNKLFGQNNSSNKELEELLANMESSKPNTLKIINELIATSAQISSFDLKLLFFGQNILASTQHLQQFAEGISVTTSEISSGMNQVAQAVTDSANSLNDISTKTQLLNENTNKYSNKLTKIQSAHSDINEYANEVQNNVTKLIEFFNNVENIITNIGQIADQTNLLALNASIEAARAGESGKGFSVVANEIKNLSSGTKDMLASMKNLVTDINLASQKSSESISKTVESIHKSNEDIEEMVFLSKENNIAISELTENISSIAAQNEEINASVEEIFASTNSISHEAKSSSNLVNELTSTAQSINELGTNISDIERNLTNVTHVGGKLGSSGFFRIENSTFLTNLNNSINAHKGWIQSLEGMVNSMQVKPIQTDEHKCGFGHFYYAAKPNSPAILPLWNEVENYHTKFHKLGDKVIYAIKNKNKLEAENYYNEARDLSVKIINIFEQIISETDKLNDKNEHVFE